MINVAVYLRSESSDSYLYLYSVETAKEVVNKLLADNYEMETGCISNYKVESNNKEFNQQVRDEISEYLYEVHNND